jgi:hypothetical protein
MRDATLPGMPGVRRIGIALLAGGCLAAAASSEPLPFECDDGASVVLAYVDSSPELEERSELGECGVSPIGDWNRVGFVLDTDAASVSVAGFVESEDGFTLEVGNELGLELEEDEDALVTALAIGEGRFRAPEADQDVQAEVILEIERSGDLEEQELSLAVIGPGVDLSEDLDDDPDGEQRFPVELEADEDYRAVLSAASELSNTGQGAHTLRVRVETVPVPEPAAPALLAAGALTLAAVRRRLSTIR